MTWCYTMRQIVVLSISLWSEAKWRDVPLNIFNMCVCLYTYIFGICHGLWRLQTCIPIYVTFPPRGDLNFLTHFPGKDGPSIFKCQHLACKVQNGMCDVLIKSVLLFVVKMIWEIISMPRADSGSPRNFMVNSWVFKDYESESDAKTNSRHRVCLFWVGKPLLACRVRAQSPLLAHYVNTCVCMYFGMYIHKYLFKIVCKCFENCIKFSQKLN